MGFGSDVKRDTEILNCDVGQIGSTLNNMEWCEVAVDINSKMGRSP